MSTFITILRKIGNQLSLGGRLTLPQSLLRRAFRHKHGTVIVDDFDGDLRLSLSLTDSMQRRVFWMGYYNLDIVPLLKRELRAGMVFVDVGANFGEISLVAAKCVGSSGRVIAFEPMDAVANELEMNARQNGLPQITLVRMGLSDKSAQHIPLYASCGQGLPGDEHKGLGSLFGNPVETEPAQHISVTTLDEWVTAHSINRIDMLKIDIEGAELPCLIGARQTLQTCRPRLIVEVQEPTAIAAGYHARDILDFLAKLGYTGYRIGRAGRIRPFEASKLNGVQNVLFEPPLTDTKNS